ncbi:MAG: DUF6687 family protein [Planctomycetales bacterium]
MINRFEIIDHSGPRPAAERIIFCDGSGGGTFRSETDLDLSHWRPNRTAAEYRAGTSAEICFRFLDNPRPGDWTAAVNNHVDVDGILSVYVLVHSRHALAHRRTIIQAAEMGDFWGWGEIDAQRVFQGITLSMRSGEGRAVYDEAFRRIPALIDGTDPEIGAIDASLAALRRGAELVESGAIRRSVLSDRLSHYLVPAWVAGEDDRRASYAPGFNEAGSDLGLLWPQARARWDSQRVCLVSVERRSGWFHELWFPGYLWADTEGLWQVPGLTYHDGMGSYTLDHPRLTGAIETFQRIETASGHWGLGGTPLPFGEELQQRFPLVGRFQNDQGEAAASGLSPDVVARGLEGIFD